MGKHNNALDDMKNSMLRLAVLSVACLASWEAWTGQSTIPGNFVVANPEPTFSMVQYAKLPQSVVMVARMSSDDLISAIQAKFPQLRTDDTYVSLESEELVASQGKYYRRVRLYNTDSKTGGLHGRCGQWISVWLSTDGALSGVYVDEPACPL